MAGKAILNFLSQFVSSGSSLGRPDTEGSENGVGCDLMPSPQIIQWKTSTKSCNARIRSRFNLLNSF